MRWSSVYEIMPNFSKKKIASNFYFSKACVGGSPYPLSFPRDMYGQKQTNLINDLTGLFSCLYFVCLETSCATLKLAFLDF